MATYLIVPESDWPVGVKAEGKNIKDAVKVSGVDPTEPLKVYRVLAEPRTVRFMTETVTRLEIT